jgi:predicted enzyme related to lactoylglutathione lyase
MSSGSGLPIPIDYRGCENGAKTARFRLLDRPQEGGPTAEVAGRADGRGGIASLLPKDASPHWLPYVRVDDVDATASRAERLGATIVMRPEDIPGIARFTVIRDPLGAVLAPMKPSPRAKK